MLLLRKMAEMRRGWYLAGIAILAAALSNPLVEGLANHGRLGGTLHFEDNDHASVVPALLAGIVVALGVSLRRGLERDRSEWTDVVWIVALQFAALFVMESAEQGSPAAGWVWLGGPPLAAIAVHGIAGVLMALLAGRVVDAVADALTSLVRAAFAFAVAITSRSETRFFGRRCPTHPRCRQRLFAPQIGGRAPPLAAAH